MGGDRQGSMGLVVLLWSSLGHSGPVGLVVLYGARGDGWRPPWTYGVGGPSMVIFGSLRPCGVGGHIWGMGRWVVTAMDLWGWWSSCGHLWVTEALWDW